MTLRLSDDGGGFWRPVQVVEPGPSGYSDLAIKPDGTVFCFYERGGIKGNHYHTEALTMNQNSCRPLPEMLPAAKILACVASLEYTLQRVFVSRNHKCQAVY